MSLGERGDNLFLASFGSGPVDGIVGETMLANTLGKLALWSNVCRRASAEGTVGRALSSALTMRDPCIPFAAVAHGVATSRAATNQQVISAPATPTTTPAPESTRPSFTI